jgi:hypothetical protein
MSWMSYDLSAMPQDDKTDSTTPSSRVEPPKIYLPACGALCDIFWWARRDPPAEAPALPDVKDEIP